MQCVSQHMKELKPFGDVPDKLSVQIKRSFVATRTYGQALATAAEVSKRILTVSDANETHKQCKHNSTTKSITDSS